MVASFSYNPLGTGYINFACYDVGFWAKTLERLGFEAIDANAEPEGKRTGIAALAHGDLKVVLMDPNHPERGAQVARFLAERGDMQVFSVAICVDDATKARRELVEAVECSPMKTVEGSLGRAKSFTIGLPGESTVTWELVERLEGAAVSAHDSWKSRGVDHFAIAVDDLARWEGIYHSMGFRTIYVPKGEIAGEHSAMKTVAVQRGGWVVALVEGVDRKMASQVSTYVKAHGNHAIQHAAIGFQDLRATLEELTTRGAQFRLRRIRSDPSAPLDIEDIMHEGRDHSGPLFQCFTKPLARRLDPRGVEMPEGGFFFELIQRIAPAAEATGKEQAFHDPTVIGLYRSIEYEEMDKDGGLILAEMGDYRFAQWLRDYLHGTTPKEASAA